MSPKQLSVFFPNLVNEPLYACFDLTLAGDPRPQKASLLPARNQLFSIRDLAGMLKNARFLPLHFRDFVHKILKKGSTKDWKVARGCLP